MMQLTPFNGELDKEPQLAPFDGKLDSEVQPRPALVERAWKGIQNVAAETAGNLAKLPFAAAPILPEGIKSGLLSFVDKTEDFAKRNAAPEAKGIAENVVDIGAGLAPFLATGPAGAVAILNNAITGGMDRGMQHGESASRAIAGGIASGIGNAVMMGLPMGNLGQATKSAVAMPVIGAADRAIQNQIHAAPELQQEVFNPKSMATDLAMGLGFSSLAHFGNVRQSNKFVNDVATRLERGEPLHPDETSRVQEIAKGGIGKDAQTKAQGLLDGVEPTVNNMPESPAAPVPSIISDPLPAEPSGPISSAVNKHFGIGYNPVIESGWEPGNRQQFGEESRQDGREPFVQTVDGEIIPPPKGIGYQAPGVVIDGQFQEVNKPDQLEWKPGIPRQGDASSPLPVADLLNGVQNGIDPVAVKAIESKAPESTVMPDATGNLPDSRIFPDAKTLSESPLTPAVIRDGKIYPVERAGDIHDTIIGKNKLGLKNDANERGFLTPDKQFLNREEASAYMKGQGHENVPDSLHSEDLWRLTGKENVWAGIYDSMTAPINNTSQKVKGVNGPATDSTFTKTFSQQFPSLFSGVGTNQPQAKYNKSDVQAAVKKLRDGTEITSHIQKEIAAHIQEDVANHQEMAAGSPPAKKPGINNPPSYTGATLAEVSGDLLKSHKPEPTDLPFSHSQSAKGKGITAEDATGQLRPEFKGKQTVIESKDIPAEVINAAAADGKTLADIEAYVDPSTGEHILVHDNIASKDRFDQLAYAHEMVHTGQDSGIVDRATDMFKRAKGMKLADDYLGWAEKQYGVDLKTDEGYRRAVKEATAKMIEDGKSNGIVKQVIAQVREVLRGMGLVKEVSENDLRAIATEMLRKGEQSLKADIGAKTGAGQPVKIDIPADMLKLPLPHFVDKTREMAREQFSNKTVKNAADGTDILIPWQGIKHAFSGKVSRNTAAVALHLDKLIESGVPVSDKVPDRKERGNILGVHYYTTDAMIGGENAKIKIVVREHLDGKRYYDHYELEDPAGLSGEAANQGQQQSLQPFTGSSNDLTHNATPNTENVKPDFSYVSDKLEEASQKFPAIKESVDWLKSLVNLPSQMAQTSRNAVGKMMGMRNQYSDKLESMIKEIDHTPGYAKFMKGMNSMESFFDKRPKGDNAKFHDNLRSGNIDAMTPEEKKIAAIGKQLDGEFADLVRAVDPTFPLRENHGMMTLKWIFEGADKNDPLSHVSARLMGDTAFTKKYSGKSATEILQSGADAELNPIRVLRKSLSDHIKYVSGSILMKDGMDTGRYIYVPTGGKAGEGLAKIPDSIAKVFKRIINPDPVKGSEFVDKAQYEGLMEVAKNIGIDPRRVINAGRGKLGYFSPLDGVVTQHNTDLSVLAHEVGHAIDIGKGFSGNGYDLWNRIVTEAKGVGAKGTETKSANQKMRATVKTELRNIADMMGERGGKGYTRKRVEQIAQMVESYIHAPDVMKETAPNVYKAFDEFVKSEPKLAKLAELQLGMQLTELNYEHKVPPPVYAKAFNVMDGEGNILGSFPQKEMAQNNMERLGGERVSIQIGKPTAVHAGDWYMPKQEAESLKRYLEADPLRKNPIVRGALEAKGLFTTTELYGLFHFSNIGEEGIRAKTSDVLRSVAAGDIAGAAKNLKETTGYGMLDIADKMLKNPEGFASDTDVQQKLKRAGITPERFQSSLQALYDGGLKLHRTEHEKSTAAKLIDRGAEKYPVLGGVRIAKEVASTVTDALFKKFVPDLKLSAAINALHTNERLYADRLASGEITHEQMVRNTVNSIENRFGEINYENLMLPKAFKTSLQLIFRAPGWNIGTWREIPNAVRTQANEIRRAIDKGEKPILTQEFSWLASTVALHIAEAAVIGYTAAAATGDESLKPKEWNDFFFPKVAAMTRIVPPGYLKDVFSMYHDMQSAPFFLPVNFLQSKLAGQWGRMAEIFRNKDYYGAQVRNPEDNPLVQAKDIALHMLPTPLFARSIAAEQQAAASNPATQVASVLGFNKAPSWIEKSPAQLELDSYKGKGSEALSKEDAEDRKTKKEVLSYERQGKDLPPELENKLDNISPDRVKRIMKESEKSQIETDFGRVSNVNQAVSVWGKMTKEEKLATADTMLKKINLDRKKLQNNDVRLAKLEKLVAPIEDEIDKLNAPPATEADHEAESEPPAVHPVLAERRRRRPFIGEDGE